MLETIDIQILLDIARKAGAAILEIYKEPIDVETKDDKSPLTAADKAANEVILDGLKEHYPAIPFISEEVKQLDFDTRKEWDACWLIDPLDGTKEFIKRNGEFTVNIALIQGGESVLGVVYVPVKKAMYYAIKGQGSFKQIDGEEAKQIKVRALPEDGSVKVFASRSHLNDDTQAFVDGLKARFKSVELVAAGSSLKFCMLAEGIADFYPRYAPTMEWDTAAGQIVAEEAGASVTVQPGDLPLRYNRENLLNPYFLVASNY